MNRHFRILLVFILLIAATLVVIVLNVNTGNVNIPVSSIFKIICN